MAIQHALLFNPICLASPRHRLPSASARLAHNHRRPPGAFVTWLTFCNIALCRSSSEVVCASCRLPNVSTPSPHHQPRPSRLHHESVVDSQHSTVDLSRLAVSTLSLPIHLPNARHAVSTSAILADNVVDFRKHAVRRS